MSLNAVHHDILEFARQQRAEAAEKLCVGTAKTIEEYREIVGFIRAMDAIETEIARLTTTGNDPFIER